MEEEKPDVKMSVSYAAELRVNEPEEFTVELHNDSKEVLEAIDIGFDMPVAALGVAPVVRDEKLLLKPRERTSVKFMLEGLKYGTFTYGVICTLMDQRGREHKIGQQFQVHVKGSTIPSTIISPDDIEVSFDFQTRQETILDHYPLRLVVHIMNKGDASFSVTAGMIDIRKALFLDGEVSEEKLHYEEHFKRVCAPDKVNTWTVTFEPGFKKKPRTLELELSRSLNQIT